MTLSNKRQAGFTLLEAIVSLTIIATIGIAIYGLVNSNLIHLQRAESAHRTASAVRSALGYLEGINPMHQPDGATTIGATRLQWQSRPLVEPRDGVGYPIGISIFSVGLYETEVTLSRGEKTLRRFTLRQIGHQQARSWRDEN